MRDRETGIWAFSGHRYTTLLLREASLQLTAYQSPLKQCIPEHLFNQLPHIQVDNRPPSPDDHLPVLDATTAETIRDIPVPNSLRLQRRRLIRLLSTRINVVVGLPFSILGFVYGIDKFVSMGRGSRQSRRQAMTRSPRFSKTDQSIRPTHS